MFNFILVFLFSISGFATKIPVGLTTAQDANLATLSFSHIQQPKQQGDNNNYCYIALPGEKDRAHRYCDHSYGVMYNGYIVDNICYSNANAAADKISTTKACQLSPPLFRGHCEVLFPTEKDVINRFCPDSYGVSYFGYIVNNLCYQTIDRALDIMNSLEACYDQPYYGSCRVSQPKEIDADGKYCNNTYGVMYRGRILNQRCYSTIERAMSSMKSSNICRY